MPEHLEEGMLKLAVNSPKIKAGAEDDDWTGM